MYYAANNYRIIEERLLTQLLQSKRSLQLTDTIEHLAGSFVLTDPHNNQNGRSNYEYAQAFFEWLISGDTQLSDKVKQLNPLAEKFVDSTGLPESFSSSYGHKIKAQLPVVLDEIRRNPETRRAYINLLLNEDKVILDKQSTHEFPCTLGMHLLPRNGELHMVVNMRSNNLWSVLPYDVYNFTSLQVHLSKQLGFIPGTYRHTMNSAHVFRRDLNRINNFLNPIQQ